MISRALATERLAELVVELSGAEKAPARDAIRDAMHRYGDAGDNLINVADALVNLRAHQGPTTSEGTHALR
ncbi:MAG: hypothetical protein GWN79_03710 [Actinobacteria bacterium]|nr:hypothetical protein [Actinomycetota bacterium]NIT94636.1 hypothetical protein [Actinomycetota bacterium]NIU18244.1 hypothetical protein [Actinomycetota bacterium]NIV54738.1 hypothetical protein [Actinomycetota bacterium]NIX49621.1 hypothetical protein [Actinomycetota bacterium]